jgi:hypothetical protein
MSMATGVVDAVWLAQAPQDRAVATTRNFMPKSMLDPLVSAPLRQSLAIGIAARFIGSRLQAIGSSLEPDSAPNHACGEAGFMQCSLSGSGSVATQL